MSTAPDEGQRAQKTRQALQKAMEKATSGISAHSLHSAFPWIPKKALEEVAEKMKLYLQDATMVYFSRELE